MRLSSRSVAFISVFAALHVVLYLVSPPFLWRSWSIYLEPLEGIILGPWVGFAAAFIGSVVARTIKPTDLWMFGIIAEPVGVLACGLIAKRKWKLLLVIYAVMLGAFFVHPLGRQLPIWTILDILVSLVLIYPVTRLFGKLIGEDSKRLSTLIPLIAFIGIVTDALTRVFLLIPVGLYGVIGIPLEYVLEIFIAGAVDSYIEDLLVVLVNSLIGVPIFVALRKIPGIKIPLS
jgi:predicted membrane protein